MLISKYKISDSKYDKRANQENLKKEKDDGEDRRRRSTHAVRYS